MSNGRCAETARPAASGWSGRLEDRVELAAVFDYFPGAFESARHHEAVPGGELPHIAIHTGHAHASFSEMAELMLCVTDTPLAARAGPHAGKELIARICVVIPDRELGLAGEQPIRLRNRFLRADGVAKRDDARRLGFHLAARGGGVRGGRGSLTSVTPQR